MIKIKTRELTGAALDWAVAKCAGSDPEIFEYGGATCLRFEYRLYSPSTDWSQGGPIIERERIALLMYDYFWMATMDDWTTAHIDAPWVKQGPTPLIAAMRCYVASISGDRIEIPEEVK